jgi:hypothetical protein
LANLRRKTGVATQWNPRPISQQEQENSGELFDSEGKALALSPSIVYLGGVLRSPNVVGFAACPR